MNTRLKKFIRNILISVVLLLLLFLRSGFYPTPLTAHKQSERTIHYGPSKIVHIEDFDQGKYILGKYDRWISCDTVNRHFLFFWTIGDQASGYEVDKTKPLDFTWGQSYDNLKLYGVVNDDRVKKVELTLNDGTVMTQTNFYDGDMFLFTWKLNSSSDPTNYLKEVKGYDSNNNVIFESEQD